MSIRPRHLMSLADLTPAQINRVLTHSAFLKKRSVPWIHSHLYSKKKSDASLPPQSLFLKTIALLFSKRSTRTRVAAETSAELLGGKALFLGREDIQLGVNESVRDSAIIISGMCQGIFARVGEHSEIEELARYSNVPVLNALSSLWHPTQVLADLLTLHEIVGTKPAERELDLAKQKRAAQQLKPLRPLTIAYVGDSANVLHDMLTTYPRLGHDIRVAAPPGYGAPKEVWDTVKALDIYAEGPGLGSMEGTEGLRKEKYQGVGGIGDEKSIFWTHDPREAVTGADVVVTDTWISMGQESQKAERLKAFQGYQVTEALCKGAAKEDWKFMHCLPRKADEVDDEVFYGPRSIVFPEGENRKWTIMALFDLMFGKHDLYEEAKDRKMLSFSSVKDS